MRPSIPTLVTGGLFLLGGCGQPASSTSGPEPVTDGPLDTDSDTESLDTGTPVGTVPTVPTDGDLSALAVPPPSTVENGLFSTADACATCHDNADGADAMRDGRGEGVAPFDLWQGSMMANSARDPLWRTQVAAEVAATPAAAETIEAKCARCHAPMASENAVHAGSASVGLATLTDPGPEGALARDGVSCTLCHQIAADGLGDPASFSGGYAVAGDGRVFGPHEQPFDHPMVKHSGFTPVASDHMVASELCATCHTLTTHALDATGAPTGGQVVEQGPYLEWLLSDHRDETSCQGCHLPTDDEDGQPIETAIAHNPSGRDFPPVSARRPFGRHLLVGGNTLVPQLLRDHRATLQPLASDEALDATVAAARQQLEQRTATVSVEGPVRTGDELGFAARVDVFTGHKLPTGIPIRRAWLQTTVVDADGAVVFRSGASDEAGRLVDDDGGVLASERRGGPVMPHVTQVVSAEQVPVYEAVLADAEAAPTWLLLRGEGWAKDNRLLPRGFDRDQAAASGIAPVGVEGDDDFVGGSDTVHYLLDVTGAPAPLHVEVALVYQAASARWLDELAASGTDEARALDRMLATADLSPVVVASAEASVP